MLRLIRSSTLVVLFSTMLAGSVALAQNEGQDDLDRATEAKLTARSSQDLAKVVSLLESALQRGLDEGNTEFAENLLASTLIQRGLAISSAVLSPDASRPNPRWADLRRLAVTDLERAIKLSGDQPEALYFIARLNLLPGGNPKRSAEALNHAVLAIEDRDGDDDVAIHAKVLTLRATIAEDREKKLADLDEALRIAPRDVAAIRTRALVRAGLGKLEEALADLDKAIELAPNHTFAYGAKAAVLAKLKKYDEALVSLDKLRELAPNSVRPLVQKARIHLQQSNLDAALHELDQAFLLDPEDLTVLLLRAGVCEELNQTEQALADVGRVLKQKPDFAAAVRLRAMLLARTDRIEEAIATLEDFRKRVPKDLAAMVQLGMLYNAEKRHEQAIETFSAVLAEKTDHWIALRGRADSMLNSGKHKQAVNDYDQAAKLNPKDPGILNNLAWVLATSPKKKVRDGRRAVELATEACELTEYKQAHILSTLAAAYAEIGDFEAAIKWSEKGLEVAEEEQTEPLSKELESYRAGKPWRELLSEGQPQ